MMMMMMTMMMMTVMTSHCVRKANLLPLAWLLLLLQLVGVKSGAWSFRWFCEILFQSSVGTIKLFFFTVGFPFLSIA